MPEISASQYADILFRWFHVIFGVMWIGLLYFFNFVNANFAAALDADTKKKVVPELMPRALFFFRWAAMITFIAGLILLYINYLMPGAGASMNSDRGTWIMVGAGFGTIMWFNVWFVIWPNQRKIINGLKTGNPAPANIVKLAANASKVNVYLSFPMLFAMLATHHFPYAPWYFVLIVVLLGFAIAFHLYKIGPKVSTNV
jgi:uncharacterized membrane protein